MNVKGISWLGVRTLAFDEMVTFYGHTLGLPRVGDDAGFAAFKLPDGTIIEVFATGSPGSEHFTTGPVAGFQVDDIEEARRELEAAGIEFIGDIEGQRSRWSHFRGPDGNVYELSQPAR